MARAHWDMRHADALARADRAASPRLRLLYRALADHYRSMAIAADDNRPPGDER